MTQERLHLFPIIEAAMETAMEKGTKCVGPVSMTFPIVTIASSASTLEIPQNNEYHRSDVQHLHRLGRELDTSVIMKSGKYDKDFLPDVRLQ